MGELKPDFLKALPSVIRGTNKFFIVYKPDIAIAAVQVQLEDGQTYDVYADDFEKTPQLSRLPLWDQVMKMACTEGQAVYIFGKTEAEDSVKSARMEPKKDEQITIAQGLRENALSFAGKARRAGGTAHQRIGYHSTVRRSQW